MAGRNIYPTDIERAAASVEGVRDGNAAAVRLLAEEGRVSRSRCWWSRGRPATRRRRTGSGGR
jgi:hypothetical protein